jgi:hypothetical protein
MLSGLYLIYALSTAASGIHQSLPAVPAELRPPLAAVSRIATGLQADMVCQRMSAESRTDVTAQLSLAVQTLHNRMVQAGVSAGKSQRILTRLMDEGENLAKHNYPACTNTAPDIIVKATQDAACINLYLAGSNTMCFR